MTDAGTDRFDVDVAMGVGLVLLNEVSIAEAADVAGVTRWELEDAIEGAGLAERVGLAADGDVTAEIDAVLDGGD